jgi:hypothetical protein
LGEGTEHKAIKKAIIETLSENGYKVLGEVYIDYVRGSGPDIHPHQRVDIFAWKPETDKGFAIEIYSLLPRDYNNIVKRIQKHEQLKEAKGLRELLKKQREISRRNMSTIWS